ncbi:protein FAM180A isoform X1 [Perca fluviatilis]|uniref:protein FAM180A isoform X1 n=1 Tax=Perca fluviatilis TaxID=8168 RepID=UPI001965C33E|nr:protein FAM180A isoform X1 [Perca fluviatilis]
MSLHIGRRIFIHHCDVYPLRESVHSGVCVCVCVCRSVSEDQHDTVVGSAHHCLPVHVPGSPSASQERIKRGAYSLINPTFQGSSEDVNLLFEILLAGMEIQGGEMLIPDEELASLRSVEKLEVICEDVLPKRLSDIRRLIAELAQRRQPLSWQDFERTVLTLVYTTQTLARVSSPQQREAWTDAVIQLFKAVQKDLTPF